MWERVGAASYFWGETSVKLHINHLVIVVVAGL